MINQLLYATWVERLVALTAQALVLWCVGAQLEGDHFWALCSILAMTLVLEYLAWQQGIAQGMAIYAALTPQQQADVSAILNSTDDSTEEEQK
jgi:hypothetical protein